MPSPQVRVVGSGFSSFTYGGKPIAFLESVEDSGQRAYSNAGQGYEFIHPLNDAAGNTAVTPLEIVTTRVLTGGTLMLTIRELWNQAVWQQLVGLSGSSNIVDIFEVLAANPAYVQCQLIIRPPAGATDPSGKALTARGKVYNNCTVVDINDGDTVTIGALSVTKGITVAYTHATLFSGS